MAESFPTTGDLVKAKAITSPDVDALMAAYEANPDAGPLPLGDGYRLDVGAAIKAHQPSADALAMPSIPAGAPTRSA